MFHVEGLDVAGVGHSGVYGEIPVLVDIQLRICSNIGRLTRQIQDFLLTLLSILLLRVSFVGVQSHWSVRITSLRDRKVIFSRRVLGKFSFSINLITQSSILVTTHTTLNSLAPLRVKL